MQYKVLFQSAGQPKENKKKKRQGEIDRKLQVKLILIEEFAFVLLEVLYCKLDTFVETTFCITIYLCCPTVQHMGGYPT